MTLWFIILNTRWIPVKVALVERLKVFWPTFSILYWKNRPPQHQLVFFHRAVRKSLHLSTTDIPIDHCVSVKDRGAVTAVPSSEGSSAPGSPDKLNLAGRQGEVAAELDRLAQSASSRLNPPPPSVPVSTTGDNSSSECWFGSVILFHSFPPSPLKHNLLIYIIHTPTSI